jgi:hypothetical protein
VVEVESRTRVHGGDVVHFLVGQTWPHETSDAGWQIYLSC